MNDLSLLRRVLGLSAKPASFFMIALCFVAVFSSCENLGDRFLNEIELDLESQEDLLVLESTIHHSDTLITVYFSKSVSILEEESSALVKEATVEMFINDISFGTLEEVEVSSWRDNELGSVYQIRIDSAEIAAGDEVRIDATTPTGETVSAIEQMPSAVSLVSATYLQDRQTVGYYYSDNSIRLVIDDPGDEENYYVFFGEEHFRGLIGSPNTGFDTVAFINEVNLEPGDAFTVGDYLNNPIGNDLTFNGNQGTVILGTWWEPQMRQFEDSELFVRLGSINKSAYDYDKTLDALFGAEGNPFAEPVILPNSIVGGRGVLRLIHDGFVLRADLE